MRFCIFNEFPCDAYAVDPWTTLRNSDTLARLSFSSMAFKALHILTLVFHSSIISRYHLLPLCSSVCSSFAWNSLICLINSFCSSLKFKGHFFYVFSDLLGAKYMFPQSAIYISNTVCYKFIYMFLPHWIVRLWKVGTVLLCISGYLDQCQIHRRNIIKICWQNK